LSLQNCIIFCKEKDKSLPGDERKEFYFLCFFGAPNVEKALLAVTTFQTLCPSFFRPL